MTFPDGLGERAIQDIVRDHPRIGAILAQHEIACVTCSVGICLLKDVVSIHGLPPEQEAAIEREITQYLHTRPQGRKEG